MQKPTDAARAAYRALHRSAIVVDRSSRRRLTLEGERSAEVLNGLVTNDVLGLAPGDGLYAMALTPKGKVIADLRVFRLGDRLLFDTTALAGDGLWSMVRKYVNPRLARYADSSAVLSEVGVFGPDATRMVAAALALEADSLGALASYSHRPIPGADHALVARVPDLGVLGFSLLVPAASRAEVTTRLEEAGALPAPDETVECARIEAGRPEWGVDMDDTNLAQEANLEELGGVSFTKGCYTGQETVARLHFRGHVNKLLRALHFEANSVVRRGAVLHAPDSDVTVGEVRSSCLSPELGGVGIAIVRRDTTPGTVLVARHGDDAASVTVQALPYQNA